MGRRFCQIVIVGSLVMSLGLAVGCGSSFTMRSTLGTKMGDREVKASLDGSGSISSQDDAAVITFSAGKLVVEKGAVKLNDQELAKLPEDAKKILVDYTGGKLTVTVDEKSVVSKEIK
jgi:hypothetical protein